MDIEEAQKLLEPFRYEGFHFDPEKHRYTVDGEYYPSVTGLCKKYKPPFDQDAISKRVAEREGKTQAQVLAEWKAKGKKATDLGTEVHELIEAYWRGQTPLADGTMVVSEEAKKRFAAFLAFRQKKLPNLFVIEPELKIFSRRYKAAGTIDWFGLNRRDGGLYIFDWKTNGKFRTDTEMSFGKLLGPFSEYDDNELNNYSIQLSYYRLFLKEEAGIVTKGAALVHIPPEGGNAVLYHAKDFTEILKDELISGQGPEF